MGFIKVTIFGFALTALWSPMSAIIMPLLVLHFVAESQKNTYLGLITFVGLILAIIIQPLAGAISDRSSFSWGRRRPYILVGTLVSIVLLMSLGLANSLTAVLLIYCFLQVSSNTAHGPWQGFIPDQVPANKRGTASAVKGILETLGAAAGIQLAGYFLSARFAGEQDTKLFLVLGVIAFIMAAAMVATVLTVKEKALIPTNRISVLQSIHDTFKITIRAESSFIFFIISRLLFLMPLIMLRTFGLYFLKDIAEMADPVAVASDLMVAVGVSLLIVIYPAGHLSDKFGRRVIVMASGIVGALGLMILLLFHTYFYIMLAGALLGIANGCFMSANWAMATDLVGKGDEARHLGLTNLATAGASAVATLAGPMVDFLNTYGLNLGYQIMVAISIIFLLVSSTLVFRIKTR